MNENIDLTKILKDCPKGWKLYSTIFGEVEFVECNILYQIVVAKESKYYYFTSKGTFIFERIKYNLGECVLFPSREQRDWSKFSAPWYNPGKQDEQSSAKINERAWLYLVSDVLTWKDGIGQYLDDPRVQELAKKLYSEYSQKLYNPSKNEQKSADKIGPKFKVGDWVVYDNNSVYQVKEIEYIIDTIPRYELKNIDGDKLSIPFTSDYILKNWTIQDAKDGDVLALSWLEDKNLWAKIVIFKKYHSEGVKGLYYNMPCVEGYGITLKNGKTVFNEKIPYYSKTWTCNLHPATKEQRDLLFQKMKEAGYNWNTETNTFEKFYL